MKILFRCIFILSFVIVVVQCSLRACMFGPADHGKPCFCNSSSETHVTTTGDDSKNLIQNVFKLACGISSQGSLNRILKFHKENKWSTALNKCRRDTAECDILTSVGIRGEVPERYLGYPMVTWSSVGSMTIIHTDNKRYQWRLVFSNFLQSVVHVWPLFTLCMFVAFASGIIIWILETWFNEEEFPLSFIKGPYEGFWWSFVSMTTVGYGDRAPRFVFGRIYSIFFIIIGISLIGVLTSILSNGLSEAMAPYTASIVGQKVGYTEGSSYAQIIENYGGQAISYKNYEILEKAIAHGYVQAFAYETSALDEKFKTRLTKINYIEWLLITQNTTFSRSGILFPKTGRQQITNQCPWSASSCTSKPWDCSDQLLSTQPYCCRYYMAENVTNCFKVYFDYFRIDNPDFTVSHYLDKSYFQDPDDSHTFSLVETSSEEFQQYILICCITVAAVVAFLLLMELLFCRKRYQRKKELNYNDGYDGEDHKSSTVQDRCISAHFRKLQHITEAKYQSVEKSVRKDIMDMQRDLKMNLSEINRNDYNLKMFPRNHLRSENEYF